MNIEFFIKNTTSKIELVEYQVNLSLKVKFWVKRDDLLDSSISGNKWRKLKHNFIHAAQQEYSGVASFGGAFSNHIAALAQAGAKASIPTIGFIRTHEIDNNNPTLSLAKKLGMTLIAISRNDYKNRHCPKFVATLQEKYPNFYFVPEGGSNDLSSIGLDELATECNEQIDFDTIVCPLGSGGTIKGLSAALPNKKCLGIAVVNDKPLINELITNPEIKNVSVYTGSMFGGYGKTSKELIHFCLDFYNQTGIAIEPTYSGKMFYALCHQQKELGIADYEKILAIHTGGLQGLQGLLYRDIIQYNEWSTILDSFSQV